MKDVLFYQTDLAGADARGADWSRGAMSGNETRSWDGLRLDGAKLRGFRFQCSEEYPCFAFPDKAISLRGADVSGADFSSYWARTDWTGARFDRTRVNLNQLLEIGTGRFAGPLVVTEGKVEVPLEPREFAWLRRHIGNTRAHAPRDGPGIRPPLRPGETAFYVEPWLRFDPAARASPLYRRLLPAVVSRASSAMTVTGREDGALDAEGTAAGPAGHACDLSVRGLRFDRRSGWFLGSLPLGKERAPTPLLRFDRDSVEVREQGHVEPWGFCGYRAGFGRMERVPLSREEGLRMFAERADRWGLGGP